MSTVQSNRRLAIVFGFLMFFTLVSFVYAFVQQAEAKRQAELAMQMKNELESCKELMALQNLKSAK